MKKSIILIIGVIISLSAFSQGKDSTVRKPLIIKLTLPEFSYHVNNIVKIEQYLDKTNLPHQEVAQIIEALDSLRKELTTQGLPQLPKGK
jgi:hypothetical protein